MKKMFFLLILFVLNGCWSDQSVKEALEKAAKEKVAIKSFNIISKAMEDYCDENNAIRSYSCSIPDELFDAESYYSVKAVREGDASILRMLFSQSCYEGDYNALCKSLSVKDEADLKEEFKHKVIALAKDSKDKDILITAAYIYGDVNLGILNYEEQIKLLNKAWKAGDAKAAELLIKRYYLMRDFEKAYLWRIKCASFCGYRIDNYGIDGHEIIYLNTIEEKLSPERILKIQKEAALIDPS